MAEAVIGDLHERVAAEVLHLVEDLLGEEEAVCVQLLHKHAALVDLPQDVHEALMHHRLAARNGEGVNAEVPRLVEQIAQVVEGPLRHERRVVGGVEAMQAVIVAFPRDHQIQLGEIAIVIVPVARPRRGALALFAGHDQPPHRKGGHGLVKCDVVLAVALAHDRKLPLRQRQRVGMVLVVVSVRNSLPAPQGDRIRKRKIHRLIPQITERIFSGQA